MRRAGLTVAAMMLLAQVAGAVGPAPGGWSWRFIAGGAMVGGGVFDDAGRFYFTAEDRFLYALDPDGVMRWRTDLGRRPAGPVGVGADGSVYAGLEDGRLLALNKDGRLLWSVRLTAGRLLPPVLLHSGTVIIADATGRVVAVTHAGRTVFELTLGEELSCPPVVGFDGRILVGTVGGNLVAIDATGRAAGARYVGAVPSVLAPDAAGVLVGTTSGFLIRMDAGREPVWRVDLGSAVARIVAAEDGEAYALLDDGSLARVSQGGVATWRAHPVPQAIVRAVSVADAGGERGVLVAITGGSLAFIRADGALLWQLPLAASPLGVTVGPDGSIVASTSRWVTYDFPGRMEPSGAWPFDRGTPSATGVPPRVVVARPDVSRYADSLDYIYLSEFLRSPFADDQLRGMEEIAARAGREGGLAGSYPYVLALCEEVAGAVTFGPPSSGRRRTSDQAQRRAIAVLGEIGDLGTARFLLRLLRAEERPDMQVEILRALAALGTDAGGNGVAAAREVIDSDVSRGPADQVALAVIEYLQAVYRYEGGFVSAEGVDLLTRIMGGAYGETARDRAAAALRGLSESR